MKQKIRCIEKQFLLAIKSNDLISIKLFQVNDNYFGYPENNLWIIDGGITLKFKDTTYSLAWNQDTDEFSFENQCFEKIYEDDNYTEIDIEAVKLYSSNNALFEPLRSITGGLVIESGFMKSFIGI